jgi:hypothetical protein
VIDWGVIVPSTYGNEKAVFGPYPTIRAELGKLLIGLGEKPCAGTIVLLTLTAFYSLC